MKGVERKTNLKKLSSWSETCFEGQNYSHLLMKQLKVTILFIAVIAAKSFAQVSKVNIDRFSPSLKIKDFNVKMDAYHLKNRSLIEYRRKPTTVLEFEPISNLNHYGYFCKIEDNYSIHHKGLQPRFRIGNIDYVNKIEGKKY